MKDFSVSHLSDHALLRDLAALVARDRATTAEMLAHIAEVDARKLYLPAAYPSMFAYCIGELRLCEQATFKRILVARTARRFPVIFAAIPQGRLHLSAVVLLAPHLTEGNASERLAAATHQTKSEIERMLAERFPRTDVLAWVQASPASAGTASIDQHAPGRVEDGLSPGIVAGQLSPGIVAPDSAGKRSRVKPLSPESFAVQFTMKRSTHEKLRYAQALLGHQVPPGDIAEVLARALGALIQRLEKQKFSATSNPRRGHGRTTRSPRHVPADVKRAVWGRDGGRCTFTSETGLRCEAHTRLEFDHVQEVARGGETTVSGIRLRCRAHNQYTAECTFGPEFMRHKRAAAAEVRAAKKAPNSSPASSANPRASWASPARAPS